ncbi:MAG: OAM dimerization domain-containing protein [Promethearchaeati archaeon]
MANNFNLKENKDLRANLDLTRVKPYGDIMNDGKVQISFTLPLQEDVKALEAAKILAIKMGIQDPLITYHKKLDKGFTFFIIYGEVDHFINYTKIKIDSIDSDVMSFKEINEYIKNHLGRKIIVLGASTGTDAHTVGIDAIMNMKGYAGHYGLERYEMIEAYNMGAQVSNEKFAAKAIELNTDVLLVSQTVTEKNIHVENLTNLVDLLEAEGLRDRIILICGGARIENKLAKELGYDAGFGSGTTPEMVATYFVKELCKRKLNHSKS